MEALCYCLPIIQPDPVQLEIISDLYLQNTGKCRVHVLHHDTPQAQPLQSPVQFKLVHSATTLYILLLQPSCPLPQRFALSFDILLSLLCAQASHLYVCAPSTTLHDNLIQQYQFSHLLSHCYPPLSSNSGFDRHGHRATSQQRRLHHLVVPSKRFCKAKHRQDLLAELQSSCIPDGKAQPVSRVLRYYSEA